MAVMILVSTCTSKYIVLVNGSLSDDYGQTLMKLYLGGRDSGRDSKFLDTFDKVNCAIRPCNIYGHSYRSFHE